MYMPYISIDVFQIKIKISVSSFFLLSNFIFSIFYWWILHTIIIIIFIWLMLMFDEPCDKILYIVV